MDGGQARTLVKSRKNVAEALQLVFIDMASIVEELLPSPNNCQG